MFRKFACSWVFFRILKDPVLPGAVSPFLKGDLQAIVSGLLGLLVQGEYHHLIFS